MATRDAKSGTCLHRQLKRVPYNNASSGGADGEAADAGGAEGGREVVGAVSDAFPPSAKDLSAGLLKTLAVGT